jgi:hypothetical protein
MGRPIICGTRSMWNGTAYGRKKPEPPLGIPLKSRSKKRRSCKIECNCVLLNVVFNSYIVEEDWSVGPMQRGLPGRGQNLPIRSLIYTPWKTLPWYVTGPMKWQTNVGGKNACLCVLPYAPSNFWELRFFLSQEMPFQAVYDLR